MRSKAMIALLAVAALLLIAIIVLFLTMQDGGMAVLGQVDGDATPEITPPVAIAATREEVTPPPALLSPEETVRRYLTAWHQGDEGAMGQYLIEAHKGEKTPDLEYVGSVTVSDCHDLTPKETAERFDRRIYPDAFAIAMVQADFIIHYNEAGQDYFLSQSSPREDYLFWLVKEDGESGWRIANQGY